MPKASCFTLLRPGGRPGARWQRGAGDGDGGTVAVRVRTPRWEQAASAEAEARSRSAAAQAANTDKGRRREAEIAVTQAQLVQARSSAQLAASDLTRQGATAGTGLCGPAPGRDDAATLVRKPTAHCRARGRLRPWRQLPARPDERSSARAPGRRG